MQLFIVTINDYGHGDCQHAIIRARSKEEAYEMIKKEGHRVTEGIQDVCLLDNYMNINKEIVRIV